MYSQAAVPIFINKFENKLVANVCAVLSGVILLSLLAQLKVVLPWTPVPITGQTFGVTLVSLLWGWKRGAAVLSLYLLAGSVGAPVFALGQSGFLMGPTLGYLVGMFFASFVVGYLSDIGFSNNFSKSVIAAYAGSFIVFLCGLLVLSVFVPKEALFTLGVLPFLPGDLVKNLLAAFFATKLRNKIN